MSIQSQLDALSNGRHSRWLSGFEVGTALYAPVGSLGVWEKVHVLLTPQEIEAYLSDADEVFPANCFPIAVDLGCNYFVLTADGSVTYFDYSDFYSRNRDVNVYPVAPNFERFASELREAHEPPAGSRAAHLLHADTQRAGGTGRDEIWHFAGRTLQCIERGMFTTFFVSKYRP